MMPSRTHAFDDPDLVVRGRFFGPAVLSPFADDMAGRLSRLAMGPLLETMADIGTLTQAIAASVSVDLTVIATDANPDLLRYAAQKPGTASVTWRQADPAALPFGDASFGIVTCLFGIATAADRIACFREARRVLKPGGRLLFAVPGPLRQTPVAACVQQALAGVFPDDPPRHLSFGLHGYADTELIDDDLTKAGFTDAAYTILDLPFSAHSAGDVAMGYCLGTEMRAELEAREGDVPAVIDAVEAALRQQFGDGPIRSTMRANMVSAAG
jgi:SAM-dependent methyltransferase